jgi:hypothetical protein
VAGVEAGGGGRPRERKEVGFRGEGRPL